MPNQKFVYPKTKNLNQLPIEIQKVMITTASLYEITPDKMWIRCRKDEIVDARQTAILVIYENYGNAGDIRGYSLSKIGSFFNQHHTTIINSIKKAKDLLDVDSEFCEKYNEVNSIAKVKARKPKASAIISIMDELNLDNSHKALEFLEELLEIQKIEEAVQQFPEIPKNKELSTTPISKNQKTD